MDYEKPGKEWREISTGERSLLFYLCDALQAAPKKAPLVLKLALENPFGDDYSPAYKQIIEHLMTVAVEDIPDEEKKLRKALL